MNNWLNKIRSNSRVLMYALFMYIIAQFLWWEILLVRQNNALIEEKQKLLGLTISNADQLKAEVDKLQQSKIQKTYMVVGEGTIFLLLLLYGVSLIRKANRKERELLDQKNNFLLSITHELKTPLATTKLQLQTLKKHQLSEQKQQELVDIAISENERLNSLIDNVLLAAHMQENKYEIAKERADLSDLVAKIIITNYKPSLDSGNLRMHIEPGVFCEVDKLSFPSILMNLIDNAFKYSGELTSVEVNLMNADNKVVLQVKDRGIGIKDQEKKLIFEQFYRSGSEETRRAKGTGLGLFIVKYLIEKHGGAISVKDNPLGGSIFEIVL